jgi:hypothetical protein
MVEPIALWVASSGTEDEIDVQPQSPEKLAYIDSSGQPRQWCLDSSSAIKFDRPCDQAYDFRFRYRQRFALSDNSTTNWLLTNHPDIYLAATLMWGAGYNESWANGSIWKGILDEQLPMVAHTLAKSRKGTLRVDPALTSRGGGMTLSQWTNG